MKKKTGKHDTADLRNSFHVIHSGEGYHRLSYNYERFPDMLGYLEWILDSLDVMFEGIEPEEYIRQERDTVERQIEEIKRAGTDADIKVCTPSWCLSSGSYFSGVIECAGYWHEFAPAAIEVILRALRDELNHNADEYNNNDEDGYLGSLSDLKSCISSLESLAERKELSSRGFAEDFTVMIEHCIEKYLQHY